MKHIFLFFGICLIFIAGCNRKDTHEKDEQVAALNTRVSEKTPADWQMGPFRKADSVNPILTPSRSRVFFCPVRNEEVNWEEKDVFNPSAVNRDNKIYLIYRAEDMVGKYAGTSRLGLAVSEDGFHFDKFPEPVFYPENDFMKKYEWEGGCEDPRIVEDSSGNFILTYTAWDGETARLAVASSPDLLHWTKHGLVFSGFDHEKYNNLWSKSGAIICKKQGNRLVAWKVNGRYWMYWGDTDIFLAYSEDLFHWIPLEQPDGSLKPVIRPRNGYFDSELVEPGPPPLLTEQGIWMIYNSRNHPLQGDKDLPAGTYAAGQILFDRDDPSRIIARSEKNFFRPENEYEITGQVGNVCFLEGLVPLYNRWFLYYGTADSNIAVAFITNGL